MAFDKSKVFQSNYLKADDIPATGVDVTIESTWEEEVDYQNGKGPQATAQVKFQEFPKPLGLNLTNTESIEQLLGKDNSKWDGGVIRLYRTTTRNQSGAVVPCIRIQPPLGKPAPAVTAATTDPNAEAIRVRVKALIDKHHCGPAELNIVLGQITVAAFMGNGGTLAQAEAKLKAKYEPKLDDNFAPIPAVDF